MEKDYQTDVQYPPTGAAEILGEETWRFRPEICRECRGEVSNAKDCPIQDPECPRSCSS